MLNSDAGHCLFRQVISGGGGAVNHWDDPDILEEGAYSFVDPGYGSWVSGVLSLTIPDAVNGPAVQLSAAYAGDLDSGGTATYRIQLTIANHTAGDIYFQLKNETPIAMGINGNGVFFQDVLVLGENNWIRIWDNSGGEAFMDITKIEFLLQ